MIQQKYPPTNGKRRISPSKLERIKDNPEAAAALANLTYYADSQSGIQRVKTPDGFRYFRKNRPVKDTPTLSRIQKLAIPPAWEEVWICPEENGHLQATGTDSRGRKQYRYHPRWNALRNSTKFHHLLLFGKSLPRLREQVQKDLSLPGMPKEKLLASLVEIMQLTGIRVGNDAYEKIYGSFGLTTLKNRHVKRSGTRLTFSFKGKKGVYQNVELKSRRLSGIIQKCLEIPGKELFQYLDEDGIRHTIDSGAVNQYIREAAGGHFTAKDFRTWQGTLQALNSFRELGCCQDEQEIKRRINAMLEVVAKKLGNTTTVCRKYYVHPLLIELYSNGKLAAHFEEEISTDDTNSAPAGLSPEETLLLAILEKGVTAIVLDD